MGNGFAHLERGRRPGVPRPMYKAPGGTSLLIISTRAGSLDFDEVAHSIGGEIGGDSELSKMLAKNSFNALGYWAVAVVLKVWSSSFPFNGGCLMEQQKGGRGPKYLNSLSNLGGPRNPKPVISVAFERKRVGLLASRPVQH